MRYTVTYGENFEKSTQTFNDLEEAKAAAIEMQGIAAVFNIFTRQYHSFYLAGEMISNGDDYLRDTKIRIVKNGSLDIIYPMRTGYNSYYNMMLMLGSGEIRLCHPEYQRQIITEIWMDNITSLKMRKYNELYFKNRGTTPRTITIADNIDALAQLWSND